MGARATSAMDNNNVAVEVLGVSTRVGHRTCIRASLHVRHTGSLRGRYAHI